MVEEITLPIRPYVNWFHKYFFFYFRTRQINSISTNRLIQKARVAPKRLCPPPHPLWKLKKRQSSTPMAGCYGIFCNNCWMITSSVILLTLLGKIRRRVCSKLSIPQDWPNYGAFRKTTCQWIMTKCHALSDTITESTFYERCKAKDIATSKYFTWF